MIGRRGMVVRRRPLMRAAAVGGTFAAGRAMGRRAGERSSAEADQDQRLSAVEDQQAQAQQPQQAAPAQASPSVMDQLNQLTTLHQQGALSDDEFAAAKAKILGS
jgi:hypothetical protein